MRLDPNNDKYPGDLNLLNKRKHQWSRGEEKGTRYRYGSIAVLLVGFAAILFVSVKTHSGSADANQLPVHLTIWTTALLTYLVAHRGRVISQIPFDGFHSARFEVSDDTVYYVFQQGMKLKTYYIRDAAIKKIRRDDEAGVLCIEGKATVNIQTRNDETEEELDEFYALVPFDKYELDDLLAPYKRKIVKADGKLREKYREEHSS
ncbi:MAG: hypothetical protein MJ128_02530 [Mogibacterium sp.]|nr:hypothetical protein [Mogibacterium sp.]